MPNKYQTKIFIIYLIRWQLSSVILYPVICLLQSSPFAAVIIANLIGGCIFFFVDKFIFSKNLGQKMKNNKKKNNFVDKLASVLPKEKVKKVYKDVKKKMNYNFFKDKEIIKKMNLIYRLKFMQRYSDRAFSISENVAEHSFYVACIVLFLDDIYNFDLSKGLKMALTHDIPESRTTDIPFRVKQDFPEMKNAISKVEEKIIEEDFRNLSDICKEYDEKKTIESMIVHMADKIQTYQYVTHEIHHNSNDDVKEIKKEASKIIRLYQNKLKKYLKA